MKIKSIVTRTYEISLYETFNGFQIEYTSMRTGDRISEMLKDYNTATYLFDLKVRELEGQ